MTEGPDHLKSTFHDKTDLTTRQALEALAEAKIQDIAENSIIQDMSVLCTSEALPVPAETRLSVKASPFTKAEEKSPLGPLNLYLTLKGGDLLKKSLRKSSV